MAQPLGISYPIQRGQQGYFETAFDTLSNERTKLINLMHTIEGERIMQPGFGLPLLDYIFEIITNDTAIHIKADIENKINTWLPSINIVDIQVKIDIAETNDRNVILVTVNFNLDENSTKYESLTFQY
jgi:phage baseplate assembly protein W